MGAANVALVHAYWTHLGHREARLLIYMAHTALDSGRPPVYFGGWREAARAIGLDPEGKPDSARAVFGRSVSALRKAGALVWSGTAHTGRRAEYALTLDPEHTAIPARTTINERGRTVTAWERVVRATGQPVDKRARLYERGDESSWERGDDA